MSADQSAIEPHGVIDPSTGSGSVSGGPSGPSSAIASRPHSTFSLSSLPSVSSIDVSMHSLPNSLHTQPSLPNPSNGGPSSSQHNLSITGLKQLTISTGSTISNVSVSSDYSVASGRPASPPNPGPFALSAVRADFGRDSPQLNSSAKLVTSAPAIAPLSFPVRSELAINSHPHPHQSNSARGLISHSSTFSGGLNSDAGPPNAGPAAVATAPAIVIEEDPVLREKYTKELLAGMVILKHIKNGRPHQRFMDCTPDLSLIRWGKEKGRPEKSVSSSDIVSVSKGWGSDIYAPLKKNPKYAARESCCVYLTFPDRLLALEASSAAERDQIYERFEWLRKHKSRREVSLPYNVKHTAHVNREFEWSGEHLEEDFELVKQLGTGAYGSVYRARHRQSGFELAIKLVPMEQADQDSIDELKREVEVLKKLKNSTVVNYYGCWGPDKQSNLWIMMELCECSVSDILEDEQHLLTEPQIAYIVAQTLKALVYLHTAKKICHRDIKSGNILLSRDGQVKLTDFGISKQLDDRTRKRQQYTSMPQQDAPAEPVGSPLWMAPEVIRGENPSFNCDIWSLGVTAIELAEGLPPWATVTRMQAMANIVNSPPPKLQDDSIWSPEFCDFVIRCCNPDPRKRPNAMELLPHPFIMGAPVNGECLANIFTAPSKGKHPKKRPSLFNSVGSYMAKALADKESRAQFEREQMNRKKRLEQRKMLKQRLQPEKKGDGLDEAEDDDEDPIDTMGSAFGSGAYGSRGSPRSPGGSNGPEARLSLHASSGSRGARGTPNAVSNSPFAAVGVSAMASDGLPSFGAAPPSHLQSVSSFTRKHAASSAAALSSPTNAHSANGLPPAGPSVYSGSPPPS